MAVATTPSKKLIPREEVRERFGGISNTTLWRGIKLGIYPKPVKISANRDGWFESEIESTLEALAARRSAA